MKCLGFISTSSVVTSSVLELFGAKNNELDSSDASNSKTAFSAN